MRLLAMLVVAGLGFGVLAPAGGVASAGSELDTTFHPETFAENQPPASARGVLGGSADLGGGAPRQRKQP